MCTRTYYRIQGYKYSPKKNLSWQPFTTVVSNIDEDKIKGDVKYTKIDRIPCGQCLECRLQHAKEWAFRCVKEAEKYKDNIMITLTYNDENLPRSKGIDTDTGEIYESSTLVKKDHQDFLKRLRKHFKNEKIRFFMCGEYGSDDDYIDSHGIKRKATERPHYHIILFNCKFEDMKFDRWKHCEWAPKIKNALYKSKTLDKLWGKGHADLNEVNFETCRYVAGYVTKKYKGSNSKEHYELKGQIPPYTCMSRRPGIASEFFEENKEKFWEEKPMWAVTKKGLRKVKSRYFDKLMEKESEERFEKIKEERKAKSDKMWENILDKTDISKYEYINNQESKSEIKNRFLKIRK